MSQFQLWISKTHGGSLYFENCLNSKFKIKDSDIKFTFLVKYLTHLFFLVVMLKGIIYQQNIFKISDFSPIKTTSKIQMTWNEDNLKDKTSLKNKEEDLNIKMTSKRKENWNHLCNKASINMYILRKYLSDFYSTITSTMLSQCTTQPETGDIGKL